jgi:hypothetical protein
VAAANDLLYEADADAGLAGARKTFPNSSRIKKKLIELKRTK